MKKETIKWIVQIIASIATCADYRIHSDCTADSTGYNLLYGLSPDSVTISPCKSIMLSRDFWFQRNHGVGSSDHFSVSE